MNFLTAVLLSLFLHFLLLSWWWLGGMQSGIATPPTVLQVTVLQQPSLSPEEIENAKKIAEADQAAGGLVSENRLTAIRTVSTPVAKRNLLEELSPYAEMPRPAEVAVVETAPPPEPPTETMPEPPTEARIVDQDQLAREVLAAQVAAREAAAEAARAQAEARYLSRWFQEIRRIGNAESSRRGLSLTGEARVRFRILADGRVEAISVQFLSGGSLEITEIIESTIAQIRLPYPKNLVAQHDGRYHDGLWVDKIWEFSKE